jgi:hypothetical protein
LNHRNGYMFHDMFVTICSRYVHDMFHDMFVTAHCYDMFHDMFVCFTICLFTFVFIESPQWLYVSRQVCHDMFTICFTICLFISPVSRYVPDLRRVTICFTICLSLWFTASGLSDVVNSRVTQQSCCKTQARREGGFPLTARAHTRPVGEDGRGRSIHLLPQLYFDSR